MIVVVVSSLSSSSYSRDEAARASFSLPTCAVQLRWTTYIHSYIYLRAWRGFVFFFFSSLSGFACLCTGEGLETYTTTASSCLPPFVSYLLSFLSLSVCLFLSFFSILLIFDVLVSRRKSRAFPCLWRTAKFRAKETCSSHRRL